MKIMAEGSLKVDLGDVEVELLQDGTFWLDGGAMFGRTPKETWKNLCPPDESNRIELGLNCLLVRHGSTLVLIEGGIGIGHAEKFCSIFKICQSQNLLDHLKIRGLDVQDIQYFVLTHVHFDHAGWISRPQNGSFELVFPKAKIFLQKEHYQEALNPHRTVKASFLQERLAPLKDAKNLELLEGNSSIFNWLECRLTPGHTEGHQSILIHGSQRTLCFTGDLIPTASHLESRHIMSYDRHPLETYVNKVKLLEESRKNDWLLVFPHETTKNFISLRP